jgi:VanZ family protein
MATVAAAEPPVAPRHRSSAVPLALLYTGLIVYASLYPFAGWRVPRAGLSDFLWLPWPRWWTGFDLVSNLLGYLPLGALVFVALVRSGWRARLAWLGAAACGLGLSLGMETLQNFLPQRVPSNLDTGLNLAGAALGAGIGVVAHARGGVARWQTLRDRWFAQRSAGGLALLVLWPVGLLFPLPLPLAVGQVIPRVREAARAALDGTPAQDWAARWLDPGLAQPPLAPAADFLLVALGLLGPCLVAFSVSRPGWRRLVLTLGALVLGVATTTLSTALNFAPQHALAWATPEAVNAMVFATLAAVMMAWLPRRVAAALGLMSLTALVVLVAQAPADPYFGQSLQDWEQGRFIRFHGAAQWVGWLWPYAAMAQLLAALGTRGD